jgi:hypothetical protein
VLEYRTELTPGSDVEILTEWVDDQAVIWLLVGDQIVSAAQVGLRPLPIGCADDTG